MVRLKYLPILTLIISIVMLAACAENHDEATTAPAPQSAALKPGPEKTVSGEIEKGSVEIPRGKTEVPRAGGKSNSDWLPSQVSLTCALSACPPQVGVLIFATPTTDAKVDIWRCTAFLIDGDKIMSNGHCDLSDQAEGYFVTRTDMPEKTFRKIGKRLFKDFVLGPQPDPKKEPVLSGRPDIVIYQLESPITNIQPLHLATGAPRTYSTLTAIVANAVPGKDSLTMTIGQLKCNMHRHERDFPFELSEAPDVLTAFDCEGEKGNSGSPLFAEKSLDVEAIMEGAKDLNEIAKKIRETEGRALLPFESRKSIEVSNLRCMNYPSAPAAKCLAVTDAEMQKRFSGMVKATIDSLSKRTLSNASAFETGFRNYNFELRTPAQTPGGEFELMYFPSCRISASLKSFVVPSEHLRIDFDEWAKPKITSLQVNQSAGVIKYQNSSGVSGDMNWTAPFGTFVQPEKDLRTQVGKTFSFALPPCAS